MTAPVRRATLPSSEKRGKAMKKRIRGTRSRGIAFALGVIAATAVLALLLANTGSARVAAVTPVEGQYYPVNVVMQGVCEWTTSADGSHYPVVGTYFQRLFQGAWSNANELPRQGQPEDAPTSCTDRLPYPGKWRMRVFKSDGDITIRMVHFTVVIDYSKKPECIKPATRIVAVSTPGGQPTKLSLLRGTHMYTTQKVTADQDVQLTFGDGSVFRMTKGTTYMVKTCATSENRGFETNLAVKIGDMWVREPSLTPDAPRVLTPTQYCGASRGTVYWISYRARVETLAVKNGSVWLQRYSGNRPVGKRWIVKAGQTAKVRLGGKPVVKKTDTSASNPFIGWSS